ncbi:hypothetical protein BT63DRAFT_91286 [Microthyrium microscopicum]|uniref:DUF6594 domain-containing protein n=1 Tax=Microthyrium microscopicum TaxID=703497 RepID=A0A6A6TXH7_9PEZI|nr:hypothetical protein BT63DRAFT_91286 [Microthyrium microscopicum]
MEAHENVASAEKASFIDSFKHSVLPTAIEQYRTSSRSSSVDITLQLQPDEQVVEAGLQSADAINNLTDLGHVKQSIQQQKPEDAADDSGSKSEEDSVNGSDCEDADESDVEEEEEEEEIETDNEEDEESEDDREMSSDEDDNFSEPTSTSSLGHHENKKFDPPSTAPYTHPALQHLRDLASPDLHSPQPQRHFKPPATTAEEHESEHIYHPTAPHQVPVHPFAGHPQWHHTFPQMYPSHPLIPPQHLHQHLYWNHQYSLAAIPLNSRPLVANGHPIPAPEAPAPCRPARTQCHDGSNYNRLAKALSNGDGNPTPLYRRFSQLNHRVLLHLQAEITDLEDELQVIDEEMKLLTSPHSATYQKMAPSVPFIDLRSREELRELGDKRTQCLGRIFVKLGQYNKALTSHDSDIGTYPPATAHQVSGYRRWAKVNEIGDYRFLDHTEDLIALCNTPDPTRHHSSLETMPDSPGAPKRATSTCKCVDQSLMPQKFLNVLGSYTFGIVFAILVAPATGQPWWAVALSLGSAWIVELLLTRYAA